MTELSELLGKAVAALRGFQRDGVWSEERRLDVNVLWTALRPAVWRAMGDERQERDDPAAELVARFLRSQRAERVEHFRSMTTSLDALSDEAAVRQNAFDRSSASRHYTWSDRFGTKGAQSDRASLALRVLEPLRDLAHQ